MNLFRALPLILLFFFFSACASPAPVQPPVQSASSAPDRQPIPSIAEEPGTAPPAAQSEEGNYITGLAAQIAMDITTPAMTGPSKAMAAYEYLISTTTFADPVGLDIWRIRGQASPPPTYLENRALSPLAFGIGSCEDYAAALALLLRQMGFEAYYVPGLTLSVDGVFVDHAWTIARIDGAWYHLDSQLEGNILRGSTLTWRYFMRSDQTMLATHRWGQSMVDYGGFDQAQVEEILEHYQFPACPADYPTPLPRPIQLQPAPNRSALLAALEAEWLAYEQINGQLEPLEPDVIPPVFGLDGYPPK